MKVKTADLIGPALDWVVATIEGYECQFDDEVSGPWLLPQEGFLHDEKPLSKFSPSTLWSEGGPIIEREWIELGAYHDQWRAVFHGEDGSIYQDGSTPLVAAMRCFVASRLGDEVEIPDELV